MDGQTDIPKWWCNLPPPPPPHTHTHTHQGWSAIIRVYENKNDTPVWLKWGGGGALCGPGAHIHACTQRGDRCRAKSNGVHLAQGRKLKHNLQTKMFPVRRWQCGLNCTHMWKNHRLRITQNLCHCQQCGFVASMLFRPRTVCFTWRVT